MSCPASVCFCLLFVVWCVLLLIKINLSPQKDAPPPSKPTHGIIYVASSFPPWQHVTLTTLKALYDANGAKFPDNRDIMNKLKGAPEVKKYMKRLMPFVQHVKVVKRGDH